MCCKSITAKLALCEMAYEHFTNEDHKIQETQKMYHDPSSIENN